MEVKETFQRLTVVNGQASTDWKVLVIDHKRSPELGRSYIIRDGLVALNKSVLAGSKDTNDLAVFLSRQMAHVIANHEAEMRSLRYLIDFNMILVMFLPVRYVWILPVGGVRAVLNA
ncbi:hypothetical protein HYALB_00011289 [Hymenoscyphus albidus]|uniref:Peptidase M48 domain-containing protein n=1 Tax=Hymenoscyphus albidus TaxID=595503 RepID=A0A9N9Q4E1_9HELO|nr:hypothetical protein HYALB_00011289 [Hymenoscyphus albidus]